ncbi:hypothetical protein RHSIM_Rhsim05G0047300 [Rhododendron simsii]|uniref:non-specific serine/threonine protein kinase n=1 Tax=Rhododendron simsii TaxID=118357 RepID=A0A834H1R5_RHOSS|nr:hypothetical protein RHSIM_Rhsim05G0047300 [Rhododendron simsii]
MGLCWGSPSNNQTPSTTGHFSTSGGISQTTGNTTSSIGSNISGNSRFSAASGNDEAFPGGQILPDSNLRIFSFLELKTATRNFRVDTVLGEGGFGKVYKGWLEEKATSKSGSGSVVAIKKLDSESMQGFDEWQSEVHFLGRLSHPNLVKLLGYCWEENELLLVYEFMQKGSLENHLFGRGSAVQPLPWDIRLKILIGAAQGLAFLHTSDKQVIYRDFKASNILLDGCYNAKISDFGLAKLGPSASKSHITTRVMGTSGYAAPEYVATGHLYVKSDVYGFGVVLIEMLTGLRAVDQNRPGGKLNLVDWIKPHLSDRRKLKQVMDSQLQGKYPSKAALQIAQLALKCIEPEQKTRPSMKVVVETLQHLVENDEKPKEPRAKQGIKEDKLDQLIDPSLRDQISENCLKVFAEVANKCLDSLPKGRPTMADAVLRLEYALASERAVDEQFGENALRDYSLPRGDAPSSSTKFLAKGAHMKLARQRFLREAMLLPPPESKGIVSKVFQRTAKFLAKGVHIKLKKRKVYDSNGEQLLSAVSCTRSILQWKNVTLQFRRFSVGGKISRNFSSSVTIGSKIPRKFSSSAASGGNEAYPGGQILPTLNLRVFSFSELKTATRNFRINTMLGEGRFGKVYKGWLKEKATSKNGRGSAVAIKKLDAESVQGFDEWQSEVHFIGRVSHPNLVKLLGYCSENNELLLVYEFMQKGSLENHLFGRGSAVHPLPWDIRLKLLIGAAQGLAFLHTSEEQMMYTDFKAANILLDGSYNAKISGFGLAKLGSKSNITTRVMGTSGYAAPEYVATGHLYVKSDVYSFGVVLIEMLTGLRAVDPNRPGGKLNLVDWIKPHLSDGRKLKQVMDSKFQGKYPSKAALQIAQLALKCIEPERETRPSMNTIVETLQHLAATDEKPEEPRVHPRNHTSSSPSRSTAAFASSISTSPEAL